MDSQNFWDQTNQKHTDIFIILGILMEIFTDNC